VTINHDLKLLRKMLAWGIRERLLTATGFKVAGENVIRLDPESPREERLTSEEAERKLFEAAAPHLRGVITAMLETCCRPGEILSLQWQDVDLETRELTIRAEKAKTRRARRLPISSRLLAVLEMRRLDQSDQPFPPDAYVFGNRIGERVKSKGDWQKMTTLFVSKVSALSPAISSHNIIARPPFASQMQLSFTDGS